ncbi:dihydrolipoamide acetyltransferase family protein [Aeropyrum camini]|uniref:Branched-chain alpha-keto acid dehydrogenase E2 n=1 Tax=Aeropyrum camini SY1 = JCM 12091 TaxID=1198449 RepID=U3TDK4_9CREN|nr:dihydrolipoamide acetyltransferase family protein [Aeropyrum camini]BAN90516.1 branched-chain alpha-keto acid dehydrogenase E2 [Aeropyrum camini SY1 = JCM 12091]
MGRIVQVKLPDIGEGIAEGEIVEWLVEEGAVVKQFSPLVRVLTAKATVEIPSPYTGRVVRLLAKPGDVVRVGDPIVEIEVEEGAATKPQPEKAELAGEAARRGEERRPAEAAAQTPLATTAVLVRAPPRVRRLARQLGVDLTKVRGTGPRGAITEEDVRRAAAMLAAAPPPAALPPVQIEEERIPVRGIKKSMVQSMTLSKSKIPHAYIAEEVDFTELSKLREALKKDAEEKGVKLTYLPFVFKAVAKAIKKYPLVNAEFDEGKMEIVVKKTVNVGFAVDTPHGLVVPVVKNVERKGLFAIAREIAELTAKARDMRLSLDEVSGATFTITNVGSIGSVIGFPVIYPPNVAILGLHRLVEKPVYVDGELKPRKIGFVSLSFDHRALEGAYATRFLMEVKRLLENPALLFAEDYEFQ